MQKGFKTKAEKIASELRIKLGLAFHSPFPAKALIDHLEILLLKPSDIPGLCPKTLEVLNVSSKQWSAVTFYANGKPFIIHNSDHVPARQESDLMHEAAHIIREHPPGKIIQQGSLAFRTYDTEHEDEAAWLGGCLQITRKGLLWAIKRRMTTEQIAAHFGASESLVQYRRNVTGVDYQMTRLQEFYR